MSAQTRPSFCFMPPESLPAMRVRNSAHARGLKQLRRAGLALGLAYAEQIGIEADVFIDGQVFVKPEALRHIAERVLGALGIAHHIGAADDGRARIGRHNSGQHTQRRGLPCPVGTDQSEDLACAHVEAQPIDGVARRESSW